MVKSFTMKCLQLIHLFLFSVRIKAILFELYNFPKYSFGHMYNFMGMGMRLIG